jgi:hypothetical protein
VIATGPNWTMTEEWRRTHLSALHEVSSFGRVRSWAVPGFWGRVRSAPVFLNPKPNKEGYRRVNLGRGVREFIHTLVATAFLEPRPAGSEVRHLNGDPTDNRAENLAWGTALENAADRTRHGRMRVGVDHHSAKLTEDDIRRIRASLDSISQIARAFGVARKNVRAIRSGKAWAHVR